MDYERDVVHNVLKWLADYDRTCSHDVSKY